MSRELDSDTEEEFDDSESDGELPCADGENVLMLEDEHPNAALRHERRASDRGSVHFEKKYKLYVCSIFIRSIRIKVHAKKVLAAA